MAGKLANPQDKGRCKRCDYSQLEVESEPDIWEIMSKETKRIKGRRQLLHCGKYQSYCCDVAWNCQE